MKSLKIGFFFLATFLIGMSTSFAQATEASFTEEQKADMAQALESYYAVLALSEEQKGEFEAITKKYGKQMLAVKDSNIGKLQKYRKVKGIRSKKDAEMKKLLSKDQYQVYLDKQAELQKKMKAKRNQS